ncbi:MAG TPA: pitrilysin family protein [Polyangiaceae bacterium]|nr:pitrilysin family protein [Polyangiaceae bacterium]
MKTPSTLVTGVLFAAVALAPSARADAPKAVSGARAAHADASKATALEPARPVLELPFEKVKLENGLTLILHRDPSLPMVAVNIWYHVGPAYEPPGRSGFAHLFEHLMFEGSRHVGHEFDQLLESAGATNVNGTTNWDRTNYFETVPREYLELALWIESDRMGYLLDAITQERLDVQRDVVKNERRQTFENAPYGKSSLALLDTMFPAGHPYHGAVIGSMQDLSAATLDDVKDFFRSYYTPSNATLCLAGDFDPAVAKALVDKYFGTLHGRQPTRLARQATPPLAQSVRLVVDEPVELARVSYGWIAPPAYGPDDAPLDLATTILAGGRSTRLYRKLVVEGKLASEVEASSDPNALATMLDVSATAASGKAPEDIEKALDAVIEELKTTPPTAEELARAKRRTFLEIASDLEQLNGHGGESGRAGLLQRFDHYLGDPGYLPKWLAAIDAVTADDISRVVRQYMSRDARVTVITHPTAAVQNAPAPAATDAKPEPKAAKAGSGAKAPNAPKPPGGAKPPNAAKPSAGKVKP